jgi:uroporphyrinogen decarboxylase
MKNDSFIRACERKETGHTPIWLMRQAGRYMPEYLKLRENHGIMDICSDPELSSDVSAMPVDMFGFDAAIIFEDLMVPLKPAGVGFKLVDKVGPIIETPIRNVNDVDRIRNYDTNEVGFVADAIKLLKSKVDVPVIGFAGAPFTMACYLIDGARAGGFEKTMSFMENDPDGYHKLMDRLTEIVINYLNLQVNAGIDALQLFDTWCGMLDSQTYSRNVAPYTRKIFESIRTDKPKIHFSLHSSGIIDEIAANGSAVISVGWEDDLAGLWSKVGSSKAMQGNLDPSLLAAGGNQMKESAEAILSSVEGRSGYIFNLGHGVLPGTKPENVRELVELVHSH